MHVVIDGRMVSNTGIGRWLENILAHLLKLNSHHEFTVLVNRASQRLRRFPAVTRALSLSVPLYSLREQVLLPIEGSFCRPDLLHYPNFNLPLLNPAPYVLTLCDLIYYLFPQACPSRMAHYGARWMIRRATEKARRIITISEYSKCDLVRHLGIDPRKIVVVYPAVNREVYRPDWPANASRAVQQKFGIVRPYIFYTGNHELRKNLGVLLQAFRELPGRQSYELVLGGRVDPRRQALYASGADLVARGDVIFCGEVSEEDLPLLYAGATLFVFPSSYEGFGLPPLEAMACGAPVITTTATSLPEVVGDAAMLVPAEDASALREAMASALASESLRTELREKGLARARRFSWEEAARAILAVYELALNN